MLHGCCKSRTENKIISNAGFSLFFFFPAFDSPETGRLNYPAGKPTSMRYRCRMRLKTMSCLLREKLHLLKEVSPCLFNIKARVKFFSLSVWNAFNVQQKQTILGEWKCHILNFTFNAQTNANEDFSALPRRECFFYPLNKLSQLDLSLLLYRFC